jgi:hypothetical protein
MLIARMGLEPLSAAGDNRANNSLELADKTGIDRAPISPRPAAVNSDIHHAGRTFSIIGDLIAGRETYMYNSAQSRFLQLRRV